ncbi:MAG: DegT/DnrJ/EryC1/StrS family aminotransferase [Alphaproteobacteria bacterium]|nr:DegT/DnrJ/EryC1/StrS family aminotransferase [Alphaproteobacteria bacterium]
MAVYVTKSFMPPLDEYNKYVVGIFERAILTNQGPNVQELQQKLSCFLDVQNFHYLSNGTVALQLALSALDINDGEIITTPFSYVATTSSVLWQQCKPVFVDIEPNNFTIDVDKIESAITDKTRAIMAVHVFGYACDVDKIQKIADKYGLKVIYDGAHAFGARYKGKSLLSYGDISTCSFHATKLFHTIEGGACIVRDKAVSDKLELQKRFGHNGDEHYMLGINAKQSEFHAAMGLANFPYIKDIIADRKRVSDTYDKLLVGCVGRPQEQVELEYNYAYYPVVFKSEDELLKVFAALNAQDIFPRRYFYPSLNKLPYVDDVPCPISEDISSRIACLPLYVGLSDNIIQIICKTIKQVCGR